MAEVIPPEEALERFVACAICIGYCHDSGRSHLTDDFQRDMFGLHLLLGADEPSRLDVLSNLVATNSNPWVRYHAAILMLQSGRKDALPILEALEQQSGGMYGPLASVLVKFSKRTEP